MVLDIRYLEHPGPTCVPDVQPAPTGDSLESLLAIAACASTPCSQVQAIDQLRQFMPGDAGFDRLWGIIGVAGDPRRRLAAQLLGYHRQWLSSRSRLRQLVILARQEQDVEVSCALVWCLRQRVEIGEFLVHRFPQTAREAALGLPLNRQTLPVILEALLLDAGPHSECKHILLERLRSIHPSLVRELVDFLLEKGASMRAPQLDAIFSYLPQLPLFEILLEERQLPRWGPDDVDYATRARLWQQLVRSARQTLEGTPSFELLRHLCTRSSEDETFAYRHACLLHAVVERTDAGVGEELIAHLERLTFRAPENKIMRLAQLAVALSERFEGPVGAQAAALLESWKNRSVDLRLKIYHLQHNLK